MKFRQQSSLKGKSPLPTSSETKQALLSKLSMTQGPSQKLPQRLPQIKKVKSKALPS